MRLIDAERLIGDICANVVGISEGNRTYLPEKELFDEIAKAPVASAEKDESEIEKAKQEIQYLREENARLYGQNKRFATILQTLQFVFGRKFE